ncbi:MAG TPA: LPS assembly lipoprotein LptE [Caulobacteraceae bacterium]|jgi:LPS-assembly lipoprotein|nr:LPS assembly lipoprotein LptE [Caulobacteraceae bacterium]
MNARWSALGAAAAALALGGCGFTPLYSIPGVGKGLSHIEVVAPPQDRVGFLLHEDLDDDFGHEQGAPPIYRLTMELKQLRTAHGLTANATAQRYELDMRVDYTLTEIATGKVAHSGTVISNVSYDSADQPYAGIAARQDTQDRLASDAAQKIEIEIAAWMAGRAG